MKTLFLWTKRWNNLPAQIKVCMSVHAFKYDVKKLFLYDMKKKENDIFLNY